MKEMLLMGRGGEGVVVASQLLAETLARAGFWVQSFPEFTAERRGAPIAAYVRWDDAGRIHRRYKMRSCDVLAVISPSPPSAETLGRVRPGGLVVLNRETRLPVAGDFTLARVPATAIAQACATLSAEGRPMGNIALLGACVKLLAPGALTCLENAVAARMGAAAAANIAAGRDGYAQVSRQHTLATDELVVLPAAGVVSRREPLRYTGSTRDTRSNHTGEWSLERPVLAAACTACALCALFCPEAAITRRDGTVVIDYLHCKGCGICSAVCPVRDAIAMEELVA
jgi:2-oxoacid:acceptor oxidoreductase gamma subunit (pyruvate/2-ketoisovalerate family)/2-oxoacid:acceptor oxidoreductase delta subunit (pyruvate/2-ketoisovalerate family)